MRRTKSKQVKIALFCFLLGCGMLVAIFLALRLRGSVVVKFGETQLAVGEAVSYRQDDKMWADDMLGDSGFTMQSSGCLVTCIAAAVSMETGNEVTPGALNHLFSENQVYDSEGNVQWAAIEEIEGYSVDVFQEVSEPEIVQNLAFGHYPIVRVRMHGIGSFHYVIIVGVEDGKYICMDPLEDELTRLSRYWNRVYAVRVVSAE